MEEEKIYSEKKKVIFLFTSIIDPYCFFKCMNILLLLKYYMKQKVHVYLVFFLWIMRILFWLFYFLRARKTYEI